jgi:hypothetical protein
MAAYSSSKDFFKSLLYSNLSKNCWGNLKPVPKVTFFFANERMCEVKLYYAALMGKEEKETAGSIVNPYSSAAFSYL